MVWLRGCCDGLRLNLPCGGLGWTSVEIGYRAGCFRDWRRPEFVGNRSGQTVLQPAAPAAAPPTRAAPAPPPARAGPPLAAGSGLVGAGLAGLLLGFVFVGFAFLGDHAG